MDYLDDLPDGRVDNASELDSLLGRYWNQLDGSKANGMEAGKLHGRMENVVWRRPLLTFTVERHGGTVFGSTRAELQNWTIDLSTGRASCAQGGHRQLHPMRPRLDVTPLVEQVAGLIVARTEDERLKWHENGRVKVLVGKAIENNAAKKTVAHRRKRFRDALRERLRLEGWHECGLYAFEKRDQ